MKYSIDNAGKLFPMTYTKEAPGCFRLVAYLYKEVDKEVLQQALNEAITRFPNYNVTLKNGLFWHYFRTNTRQPIVSKETEVPFDLIEPFKKNSFPFQVLYSENKICLEIYHALTDANGGMEFLKAICFHYLNTKEKEILNNDTILTNEVKVDKTENSDSFNENFSKNVKEYKKDPKAFRIAGEVCTPNVTSVVLDVEKLKKLCKDKSLTITEYIGGTLLYCVHKCTKESNIENLPVTLFIPVNARKYYNSKTLKNFVLYIRSPFQGNDTSTIDDSIESVKNTLRNNLSKDYLDSVIKSNVSIQKNFFLNYSLLAIKKRIMKFGYKKIAGGRSTITCSNIQEVKTPDLMKDYIDMFEFTVSPSRSLPITFSGVSYNNKLRLSFNTNIKEREIINEFISMIEKENITL